MQLSILRSELPERRQFSFELGTIMLLGHDQYRGLARLGHSGIRVSDYEVFPVLFGATEFSADAGKRTAIRLDDPVIHDEAGDKVLR